MLPSLPHLPWPILQRFRQMRRGDLFVAREVGDGAGELEDTVVGEGGEAELAHGGALELLAGRVKLAVVAHLGRAQVAIEADVAAAEASGSHSAGKRRIGLLGLYELLRDRLSEWHLAPTSSSRTRSLRPAIRCAKSIDQCAGERSAEAGVGPGLRAARPHLYAE
jgi:hypothetical protein